MVFLCRSVLPALRSLTPWPPLHSVERGNLPSASCRAQQSLLRGPSLSTKWRGTEGEASKGKAASTGTGALHHRLPHPPHRRLRVRHLAPESLDERRRPPPPLRSRGRQGVEAEV